MFNKVNPKKDFSIFGVLSFSYELYFYDLSNRSFLISSELLTENSDEFKKLFDNEPTTPTIIAFHVLKTEMRETDYFNNLTHLLDNEYSRLLFYSPDDAQHNHVQVELASECYNDFMNSLNEVTSGNNSIHQDPLYNDFTYEYSYYQVNDEHYWDACKKSINTLLNKLSFKAYVDIENCEPNNKYAKLYNKAHDNKLYTGFSVTVSDVKNLHNVYLHLTNDTVYFSDMELKISDLSILTRVAEILTDFMIKCSLVERSQIIEDMYGLK